MNKKREKWARLGMIAKGCVYILIGALSAMAAFNIGGSTSGNKNMLEFLTEQSFGKMLLGLLAIGLFGYTFYRLYQAFTNNEEEQWSDAKGFIMRSAYVISAIVYGLMGVVAILMIVRGELGSGGQSIVQQIMDKSYGPYLIGFLALCLLGKAVYQFYKAISGKFKEEVNESGISSKAKKALIRAGYVGFISRGIISGILTYLLVKVALGMRQDVEGKAAAFEFLQNTFGATIMGVVALGLIGYGVFMFLHAKNANIKM